MSVAVPCCLGDGYRGFRVVATTPDFCDKLQRFSEVGRKPFDFTHGRNFEHKEFFAAVIGSRVAQKDNLKIGDRIQLSHGRNELAQVHNSHEFQVVGVLGSAGPTIDRSVFVNIEGFYLLKGHGALGSTGDATKKGKEETTPLPESQREVTAILIVMDEPVYMAAVVDELRKSRFGQAVEPRGTLAKLLSRTSELSLLHELVIALRVADGRLSREEFSAGLQLRGSEPGKSN